MNRLIGFESALFGLLLAGAGYWIQQKVPDLGRVTLVAGGVGGAISLAWGVLVLCGHRRRWWMILTLIAVSFTLLTQTVTAWMAVEGSNAASLRPVAGPITMLLLVSFGMLLNVLHGQGRCLASPADAAVRRPDTGKPTPARSHVASR